MPIEDIYFTIYIGNEYFFQFCADLFVFLLTEVFEELFSEMFEGFAWFYFLPYAHLKIIFLSNLHQF